MKSTGFFSVLVTIVCLLTFSESVKKKKHGHKNPDDVFWKEDFEEELSKVASSNENDDKRHSLTNSRTEDVLMDKIVDSLASSDEFLKKITVIELKLTRLDAELHERTDNIMKQLGQMIKNFKDMPDLKHIESILDHIRNSKVKLEENQEAADTSIEARLSSIERILHSVASTVSVKKHSLGARDKLDNCGDNEMISLMRDFRRNFLDTRNHDCKDRRADISERYPTDCSEIQTQGFNISGIYKIKPEEGHAFYVLCDLNSVGGGWTVLQNRYDGSQDFYKPWSDYQNGFGNLAGEFWLGLDKVHQLTTQKLYSIRFELEDSQGIESYASYSVFTVGPEIEGFRISALGNYHGNAGDSLSHHAGQSFSTWDSDNDGWKDGSCAEKHGGAWWYKECGLSNLNGYYTTDGDTPKTMSMYWTPFEKASYLAKVKIMIRPLPATHPNTHINSNNPQNKKSSISKQHHSEKSHMHYRDDTLNSIFFK